MNITAIRKMIVAAILEVAPEINESEIDADAELREQCDIDSMDFLNVITVLKKSSGVSIPERDYGNLETLNQAIDYLKNNMPSDTPYSRCDHNYTVDNGVAKSSLN